MISSIHAPGTSRRAPIAMPAEAQLSFFPSILIAKGDALDHGSGHPVDGGSKL